MPTWKVLPKHSNDILEQILFARNIKTPDQTAKYLNPKVINYLSDLNIPQIDKAAKRIQQAIDQNQLIVVYGDYDVDGICAASLMYHALTTLGAKVLPYIPHREKEGYGMSKIGLDAIAEKKAGLIITVDQGIVAFEQAKYAKKLGIDLIITDHHVALEKTPESLALVHSTKMCGAAVGWCLMRQLVSQEVSASLLDLVAMATICDLIPLVGVNRAFVYEGLLQLNQAKRLGIAALMIECGIEGVIDAYKIGHIIGPRLNAVGRLSSAMDAVRLLCTKDLDKARNLARVLCKANDQRKELTAQAVSQAKQAALLSQTEQKIIVLSSPLWSPGIIGLVAGRICEEYRLPTIILNEGEVHSKGSARSVDGINVIELIRKCSDLLIDVGGHPKAAGFTINTEKIESFKSRIEQEVKTLSIHIEDELVIDALINIESVNKKLVLDLQAIEPTGEGNQKPVLGIYAVKLSDIKTVGDGKHLKFRIRTSGGGIEGIGFSKGSMADALKTNNLADIAFFPELDFFQGREKLQLKVLDIKLY